MDYFDTSFLTPLVRKENTTVRVSRFMAGMPSGELAISCWTEVEFASLLARDVRMGTIESDEAQAADAVFADMIQRSFVVLLPSEDDYELARRYLHNHKTGLRAGDALHLAVAANCRTKAIYSLDKAMIKAGNILGLPVSAGI
jgi:uncharacterized protein